MPYYLAILDVFITTLLAFVDLQKAFESNPVHK